jgi:aryl-alcohol dehydrogenase-like predicted oxidoreductase
MEKRRLGSTGFDITVIGLGTWAIGGWLWGPQNEADSLAAIEAALDTGVNWLDTAPIYGSGISEQLCGDALKKIPASRRPLVFTKFGLGDDSTRRNPAATKAQVMAECEASLKRLGVERIDLYQLHWPVPEPVIEQASACEALLKAGKIRAVGVCNFSAAELEAWKATGLPLHTLQMPLSILRSATLKEQMPWCQKNGLGTLAYSPLFRGMLFGTWTNETKFPEGDSRGTHKDYTGARFVRHLQAIDELKALAEKNGTNCANLAVGALLSNPALTACIVGARNARQGKFIGTLGQPISANVNAEVWKVIERLNADLAGMP